MILEDQSLNPPLGSLVWDFVGPNIGRLPDDFCARFPSVAHEIRQLVVREHDTLLWWLSSSGMVSCADVNHSLQDNSGSNSWGKFVWGSFDAILIRQHVWFDICMCAAECFASDRFEYGRIRSFSKLRSCR